MMLPFLTLPGQPSRSSRAAVRGRRAGARPAAALAVTLVATACGQPPADAPARWTLTGSSAAIVTDAALRDRIFKALDAAESAGTDPSISKFHVRAATVVEHDGVEHVIVGGNSEYAQMAEAIHGETSLLNHVITELGPDAARRGVRFVAFYSDRCGGGGSCGDCRDYLITTTRWEDLLMVCGQSGDRTVHVDRFAQWVVPESSFPEVAPDAIGLPAAQLDELARAAIEARAGGVALFTDDSRHLGVAALTSSGKVHRAAGADDAAFHYRFPVGAVLQQAATFRDYFVQAVVVAGPAGAVPRLSYRDRQYGLEFSSFNQKRGLPPIKLIVLEWDDRNPPAPPAAPGGPPARGFVTRYRLATFEDALPGAFTAADFMPEAVDRFLAK